MKKDVMIKIFSMQHTENGDNSGEIVLTGTLSSKDGKKVIEYTENNDETGPEETTITVFDNNTVSIVRKGQFSSEMTVEKSTRHHTFYRTPYGELTMGIYGKRVDWSDNDNGGILRMSYTLDFNNGFVSDNTMNIYIEEK